MEFLQGSSLWPTANIAWVHSLTGSTIASVVTVIVLLLLIGFLDRHINSLTSALAHTGILAISLGMFIDSLTLAIAAQDPPGDSVNAELASSHFDITLSELEQKNSPTLVSALNLVVRTPHIKASLSKPPVSQPATLKNFPHITEIPEKAAEKISAEAANQFIYSSDLQPAPKSLNDPKNAKWTSKRLSRYDDYFKNILISILDQMLTGAGLRFKRLSNQA